MDFFPPFSQSRIDDCVIAIVEEMRWGEKVRVLRGVNGENVIFTGARHGICVHYTYYNAEHKSLKSPLAQPVILLEGLLCCPRLSDRGKNSFRSAV